MLGQGEWSGVGEQENQKSLISSEGGTLSKCLKRWEEHPSLRAQPCKGPGVGVPIVFREHWSREAVPRGSRSSERVQML